MNRAPAMRFKISHSTLYNYEHPASESFMQARLAPPSTRCQTVRRRQFEIRPDCRVSSHTDYFGNTVEQFSIIHRHDSLLLSSESEIETHPMPPPPEAFDITISEARQIFRSQRLRLYDFLQPSAAVVPGSQARRQARSLFRPAGHFGESIAVLMHWVHGHFTYKAGSTNLDTSVEDALKLRKGVCQDFAHVMIAILRATGIPARYVVGYIETEGQRRAASRGERRLVGAAESHAWVDVGLPNGDWYPLDPTNDIPAGERHVVVAVGRDFHDTSPTCGVFKGAGRTSLKATVHMRRQVRR